MTLKVAHQENNRKSNRSHLSNKVILNTLKRMGLKTIKLGRRRTKWKETPMIVIIKSIFSPIEKMLRKRKTNKMWIKEQNLLIAGLGNQRCLYNQNYKHFKTRIFLKFLKRILRNLKWSSMVKKTLKVNKRKRKLRSKRMFKKMAIYRRRPNSLKIKKSNKSIMPFIKIKNLMVIMDSNSNSRIHQNH